MGVTIDRGDLYTCAGFVALSFTTEPHGWIFAGALVAMGLVANVLAAIVARSRTRELKQALAAVNLRRHLDRLKQEHRNG